VHPTVNDTVFCCPALTQQQKPTGCSTNSMDNSYIPITLKEIIHQRGSEGESRGEYSGQPQIIFIEQTMQHGYTPYQTKKSIRLGACAQQRQR
jgi:hypothetical protein